MKKSEQMIRRQGHKDLTVEQVILAELQETLEILRDIPGAQPAILSIQDFVMSEAADLGLPSQAYTPLVFAIKFVQALVNQHNTPFTEQSYAKVVDTLILISVWVADQCDVNVEGLKNGNEIQ